MEHKDAREEMARTVLRQGELWLQAQLQAALAADLRAMTSATIMIAASVAAFGFGISNATGAAAAWPLFTAGVAAGSALGLGSILCAWAARPSRFWFAGNWPKNWWQDSVESRPLSDCLKRESANYDELIAENDRAMRRNNKYLRAGMIAALASPTLGAIAWAAVAAVAA